MSQVGEADLMASWKSRQSS